jgi:predicted Zn finger-like uncharacterized protein
MLIQCHSCNTKYRLNLEQIPRRKTFVRCKNCGTPIYIDPTEDEPPAAGVIPPPPGLHPPQRNVAAQAAQAAQGGPLDGGEERDGQVQVVCPSCGARYRIAATSVRRAGVKLKCTQCGHLFAPPAHLQAPPLELGATAAPPAAPPAAAMAAGLHDGLHGAESVAPARPREMPLPDEQQMDRMFDDLRPGPAQGPAGAEPPPGPAVAAEAELGTLEDEAFTDEPPVPDAERAYEDSVAFEQDGDSAAAAGSVPDAQRYRFFLNPRSYQGSETGMADHPDDMAPPGASGSGEGAAGGLDDLPPLESGARPAPVPSTAARSREEMSRQREVVPGQKARLFTEKRVLAMVAAAAVVILVATGAWGYWLAATAGENRPFSVRVGQPHQLALEDELSGHYVTNGPSGKRLFVVNGQIESRFGPETKVRWIRLKGLAYADTGQSKLLGTAFAYAGNVLDDSQLGQWELPAVKAYYGFTNGRKELNVSIPAGAKVPYQLVFSDVDGSVARTVAQVVSYHRDGRAVFIDNP